MGLQAPVGGSRYLQTFGLGRSDSGETLGNGRGQGRRSGLAHRRILLVEDDRGIREVLLGILEQHGYAVATAENGRVALQRLLGGSGGATDLIILDLRMPVMNGWQFRAAQKADPTLAAIPVVALSADGSAKAAAIDAAAYIRKPLSTDALLGAVNRILADDDRRQLLGRLAEAERFAPVGRLAADIGQEVNNPLSQAHLNVDILTIQIKRYFEDHPQALRALPAVPVMLNECRAALDRAREVVKRLQSLPLQSTAARETFSLNALLDDSLAMAGIQLQLRATVRKEYGEVPAVVGERSALGQVFLDLILNAVEALPEAGAGAHEITVRTSAEGSHVTAEVRDSGPGISAGELPRIFDPFFTTKSIRRGIGLGLSVVSRIVADHGGRIDVDTQIGRGSVFRVVLPAAADDPVEGPAAAGSEALAQVPDPWRARHS